MKLLTAIDKKLGLGADQTIIVGAMPFLELRHLLVHQDGIADRDFCKRYPVLKAKPQKKIQLSNRLTAAARIAIVKLVQHYDALTVKANLLSKNDLQP